MRRQLVAPAALIVVFLGACASGKARGSDESRSTTSSESTISAEGTISPETTISPDTTISPETTISTETTVSTETTPESSVTSTTTRDDNEVPYLPELSPIEDPGTVDRLLGEFPVDDSRNYQRAWLKYSRSGRAMARAAVLLDSDAGVPILSDVAEEYIYYAGVVVCTEFLSNYPVDDTIEWVSGYLEDFVPTDATSDDLQFHSSIIVAAVNKLCPRAEPVLNNFDYLVSTPAMLRTILGVSYDELDHDQANAFANWVCNERDRGQTKSRLAVTIAQEYDYPDDRAEALVNQVESILCES